MLIWVCSVGQGIYKESEPDDNARPEFGLSYGL
jgi:hypothetical protein